MFSFKLTKTCKDSKARTGKITTSHGDVVTPVFMPVGTQGTVKAMTPEELVGLGAEIILGNTYHLSLRPGHETIKKLGGLHKFMHWDKPILTDSGGFQVFSLGRGADNNVAQAFRPADIGRSKDLHYDKLGEIKDRKERQEIVANGMISTKVTEEGVHFRTPIDGGREHFLTPELAVEIQEALGSDIMMVFDECLAHGENEQRTRESMELSLRWAERCLNARRSENALFGIVQGGMYRHLRVEYIERLMSIIPPTPPLGKGGVTLLKNEGMKLSSPPLKKGGEGGFDGYSIGGLSVGEPNELMYDITDCCTDLLPKDKPRYLMGVGTPEDLLECIERGVDMFDCVMPARNGRTGTVMTAKGDMHVKNARFKEDPNPPDADCTCYTCRSFSMAYIRHMFMCNEILGARLATIHNLHFYLDLIKGIRLAIENDRFKEFKESFMSLRVRHWRTKQSSALTGLLRLRSQ